MHMIDICAKCGGQRALQVDDVFCDRKSLNAPISSILTFPTKDQSLKGSILAYFDIYNPC